jgi:glycerophosphoryl diester phosphodiesterase
VTVPELPSVIGHRGAMMWAPENTLASFRKAAALGAPWVEFDVRLSKDGRCVVLHDDTLERTTSGSGRADLLTLGELRDLDAGRWFGAAFSGERIPSLEETVELLAELSLGANVEIKPAPGAERATGKAVGEALARIWPHRLPPPLLSSFKEEALAAAREAAPALARGLLVKEIPIDWAWRMAALGCVTLHCDHRRLAARRAAEIAAAGVPLLCYTVNDPVRAVELWRWGVVSVFSDCPDRLLAMAAGHT